MDDLGYGDLGVYGAKGVKTPNLDRMAANGLLFTDGHCGASTCTPSRYSLLTGNYAFRNKAAILPGDAPALITPKTPTIANMLKRAGYNTAVIGKWHLGTHPDLHPQKRGFNEFFGFLEGGHHYMPEMWTLHDDTKAKTQYDGYKTKILRNTTPIDEKEYLGHTRAGFLFSETGLAQLRAILQQVEALDLESDES